MSFVVQNSISSSYKLPTKQTVTPKDYIEMFIVNLRICDFSLYAFSLPNLLLHYERDRSQHKQDLLMI